VLNILGIGSAYPETVVDNQLIAEINSGLTADWIVENTGIEKRRSVLPLNYIRETGNGDAWRASSLVLETPTDLGVRAALMALERASVGVEEVGLVLGDCATAFQTAPSEAQRVAGKLGLKVQAFDVFSAQGPFPQHLDLLASWKEDRIPDYVLCISTNAPTLKVNYRQGYEGVYFGDAASAVVVSSRRKGKLTLQGSAYGTDVQLQNLLVLDKYNDALILVDEFKSAVAQRSAQILNSVIEQHHLLPGQYKLVGTQFDYRLLERERVEHGLTPQDCWSNVQHCGYSLGSSTGCVLAEQWEAIKPGQTIVITHVGAGLGHGHLVLKS
jgi:3-oxoacyl-[acyl-carrier-protein] synthase III